jgi:hypothetical protein
MPENPKSPQQSLSEISHLFLTGLRQRQNGGAPTPHRKPPAGIVEKSAVSIDITPEEFSSGQDAGQRPSVSALLAHHLAAPALPRVREYARQAASASGCVGLIELGDDGLRLTCFDASPLGAMDAAQEPVPGPEPVNGRRIAEAIAEMSWDIQRWILFLPGGIRTDRARQLLGRVAHWTILVGADDEGVVAAYRVIKGAVDIAAPSVSVAVLGAEDEAHSTMIHRKLAAASKRFLDRAIDCEGRVAEASNVSEHVALWCRAASGTAQGSPQEHWTAVMDLIAKSAEPAAVQPVEPPQEEPAEAEAAAPEQVIEEQAIEEQVAQEQAAPLRITPMERPVGRDEDDVLDLPIVGDGKAAADAILACVVQRQTQWVGCPVKPPMCDSAAVAVDREGRLVMVAVTAGELAELQAVSRGYGWLIENRPLVRMALPQMNINAAAMPKLVLCVDQAETKGEQLASILQNGNVTIQTYRRLRWGGKTGLLLAAA